MITKQQKHLAVRFSKEEISRPMWAFDLCLKMIREVFKKDISKHILMGNILRIDVSILEEGTPQLTNKDVEENTE